MKQLLITSTRTSSGKTIVGIGLANYFKRSMKLGYFKPFADRLVYKRNVLVDTDVEIFKSVLGLSEPSENLSVGHDYETLVSDFDPLELKKILIEKSSQILKEKNAVFVESARNFSYGTFIGLDASSLASNFRCGVILVADGDVGLVVDKCIIAESYLRPKVTTILGVIINKITPENLNNMKNIAIPALESRRINILGFIPMMDDISIYTSELVMEHLHAKVLAGEEGLSKSIKRTLIGAMTADAALKQPVLFEPMNLIITGGDRVDMILASIETGASCVVLTGNLIPHPRILSKADEYKVPILSVPMDTYTAAKQVERLEAELNPGDSDKISMISELISKNIKMDVVEKYLRS